MSSPIFISPPKKTKLVSEKFKKKLLKHLTDGSFKREKGILRSDKNTKKRCCLGVMQYVAHKMGILEEDVKKVRTREALSNHELRAIGLSYEDEDTLITYNDGDDMEKGEYYPRMVIETIKRMKVKEEKKKK